MPTRGIAVLVWLLSVASLARADLPVPVPLDAVGVSTEPLHAPVRDMVVSPDGVYLYALQGDTSLSTGRVSVLARDGSTGRLSLSSASGAGLFGETLTMAPDGRHIYVGFSHFQGVQLRILTRDAATGAVAPGPVVAGDFSAEGVAVSPDGEHVYVANARDAGELRVYDRDITTGAVTFVEAETDGIGGVDGIAEPRGILVSPDGAHVYVAGRNDNAIAAFARNAVTGALTFVGEVRQGVGGVSGLTNVTGLAISADGAHVYGLSLDVTVFSRDAGTGALTFVEVKQQGVGGVMGLLNPGRIAVSSDGAHVYVLGRDTTLANNAVVIFGRNASTGALTFVAAQGESGSGRHLSMLLGPGGAQVYVGGQGGVAAFARSAGTGLLTSEQAVTFGRLRDMVVSPDGTHLYAVGERVAFGRSFVAVYARDPGDGSVDFVETQVDGAAGVTGLDDVASVAVSADGAHLYVTGNDASTVSVFERAVPAGTLTLVQTVQDGIGGVDGLFGALGVVVSPDGAHVYVTGTGDDAVAVFVRNTSTGLLSFLEMHRDGVGGVAGLGDPSQVLISSDGAHVYVEGHGSGFTDAIAIFARNAGSGALTFLGTAIEGQGGFTGVPNDPVISPDGLHLYGATFDVPPLLVALSRNPGTGLLSFAGAIDEGFEGSSGLSGALRVASDGTHVYSSEGAVLRRDAVTGAVDFLMRATDESVSNAFALSPDGRDAYFAYDPFIVFGGTPEPMLRYQTRGFSGCGPTPIAGCHAAGRGRLRILTAGSGQLVWSYARGQATDLADLGDPRLGRTHYALCVYQGASPAVAVRMLAVAGTETICRPSASNSGRSCWDATRDGFRYRDDFESPEGIFTLKIKSGPEGRPSSKVRALGPRLDLPSLPLALPLRVQLQAANGECWETTHTIANVNDGTRVISPAD